jgi:hypothetical protein
MLLLLPPRSTVVVTFSEILAEQAIFQKNPKQHSSFILFYFQAFPPGRCYLRFLARNSEAENPSINVFHAGNATGC